METTAILCITLFVVGIWTSLASVEVEVRGGTVIIEAHGSTGSRYGKYSLFEKVGKAELVEGRAAFDTFGGRRINPYRDPLARLSDEVKRGEETLYILGHGGPTLLNGENATQWAQRLDRMGLQAGDTCNIDITACYVGRGGDGFAAQLTIQLRARSIDVTVNAPRGHIHATTTGTHIFKSRNNFYTSLWQSASREDYGDQFTKKTAIGLCKSLANERASHEVSLLYLSFLLELRYQIHPAKNNNRVTTREIDTAIQSARLPGLSNEEITSYTREVIIMFIAEGPVEYASAFIGSMKRRYGGVQPGQVTHARNVIKQEANRVWQIQKNIIEQNARPRRQYAKTFTKNPRLSFSSHDLATAEAFAADVIRMMGVPDWAGVGAIADVDAVRQLTQFCRSYGNPVGFYLISAKFLVTSGRPEFDVVCQVHGIKAPHTKTAKNLGFICTPQGTAMRLRKARVVN